MKICSKIVLTQAKFSYAAPTKAATPPNTMQKNPLRHNQQISKKRWSNQLHPAADKANESIMQNNAKQRIPKHTVQQRQQQSQQQKGQDSRHKDRQTDGTHANQQYYKTNDLALALINRKI